MCVVAKSFHLRLKPNWKSISVDNLREEMKYWRDMSRILSVDLISGAPILNSQVGKWNLEAYRLLSQIPYTCTQP